MKVCIIGASGKLSLHTIQHALDEVSTAMRRYTPVAG